MDKTIPFATREIADLPGRLKQDNQVLFYEVTDTQQICLSKPPHFFSLLLFKSSSTPEVYDLAANQASKFQIQLHFPDRHKHTKIVNHGTIYQLLISKKVFGRFGNYLKHPVSFYMKNPVLNLSKDMFQKLAHEFCCIRDELKMKRIVWDIIYTRLRIIAIMLNREAYEHFERQNGYISNPVLIQFTFLVLKHFREERSINFYAKKLFISANYLNILCKKHFGKTATSIIKDELIFELKHRLAFSSDTIKELAIDLQFNDLSGLSAFFKRYTGMSPRDFQQRHKRYT